MAILRYREPRKVSVRATPMPTSPRAPLSQGEAPSAGGVVGAAAFDLDGLGGMGEGQARADGADLHAADLAVAVPGLVGAVVEDGLAPGQSLEPAQQRGLVVRDDEQVVPSGRDDLPGVLVLGVQGVGGADPAGEVKPGQQERERGDLIALGCDHQRARDWGRSSAASRRQAQQRPCGRCKPTSMVGTVGLTMPLGHG
ncbi:hypothetical protein [Streptosporangium vulgare]|uniref:Uncharacterized protein n=1 Tax=Streptosporangium vulgare TaxID=46190 RepID=A0ABV5T6G0_9ACTN